MKWSFDVAAGNRKEIAGALKEKATQICAGIAETEKRQFGHADYVPDIDKLCRAAQALAEQLPESESHLFVANCLGEINEVNGKVTFASATISVVLHADKGQLEQQAAAPAAPLAEIAARKKAAGIG